MATEITTNLIEYISTTEEGAARVVIDNRVGPQGPPGTTLHAELTDTDTDGHPASTITHTGTYAGVLAALSGLSVTVAQISAEIDQNAVEEAPVDGSQYARIDGGWSEITASPWTRDDGRVYLDTPTDKVIIGTNAPLAPFSNASLYVKAPFGAYLASFDTSSHGFLLLTTESNPNRIRLATTSAGPKINFSTSGGDFYFSGPASGAKVGFNIDSPTATTHIVGPGNTSAEADNILKLDNSDGNVMLVRGDGYVDLPNTNFASQLGIISKGGVPFIHNFNYGNNGTVTTLGQNNFIGENAGNLTMGSTATSTIHASYNTAQGVNALRSNTTGSSNSAQGVNALRFNTTGRYNSAQGVNALCSNTTGVYNTAQGVDALYSNTTGVYNTAQGVDVLRSNTTGSSNSAQGVSALHANTTGSYNSVQGVYALRFNTTGIYNSAQGVSAGRFISNGTTALTVTNQSVFLGANTKALADNSTNEIVIGYNATGLGSNTAVFGSDSITKTALKGDVGINTILPTAKLHTVGPGNTSATYATKEESSNGDLIAASRDDGYHFARMNTTAPASVPDNMAAIYNDGGVIKVIAADDLGVTTAYTLS